MHEKAKKVTSADSKAAQEELMQQEQHVQGVKQQLDEAEMQLATNEAEQQAARRQLVKAIGLQIAIGALIDAGTSCLNSIGDEMSKCKRGEITKGQAAWNVAKTTAIGGFRGGAIAGVMAGSQWALQRMAASQISAISSTGNILGKALGPGLLLAGLSYQSYNILTSYSSGEMTTAAMQRQFCRMATSTGMSFGCMAGAAFLLGTGPLGLAIGAGACIAVAVGDHYLGEKIFGFFLQDDPNEKKAILERRCKEFEKEVITQAYKMFNLEENCSDDELKRAYKAAVLEYHPDRNMGISEEERAKKEKIFKAIFASYTLLRQHREM